MLLLLLLLLLVTLLGVTAGCMNISTFVKRNAESGGPAMTDTTSSYSRRPEAALPLPLRCVLSAEAAGSARPAAGSALAGGNCSANAVAELGQSAVRQGVVRSDPSTAPPELSE